MIPAKTAHTSIRPMLLVQLVCLVAACKPQPPKPSDVAAVPRAAWSVEIERIGSISPIFKLTIASDWTWPRSRGGEVTYEPFVRCDESPSFLRIPNATLTRSDRYSYYQYPAATQSSPGDALAKLGPAIARAREQPATLEHVLLAFDELLAVFPWRQTVLPKPERIDMGPPCRFILVPRVFFDGKEILDDLARHQDGQQQAEARYTWGQKVTNNTDPCHDKTPETCARERLQSYIERICRDPANAAICERARQWFREDKFSIPCTFDKRGHTDPITQQVTLNGEVVLTDSCAIATLYHEIVHVLDPSPTSTRVAEKRKRLQEIVDALSTKPPPPQPRLDELLRESETLTAEIQQLMPEATREKLLGECKAHSDTIAAGGTFIDLSTDEGKQWLKTEHLLMIGQLDKEYTQLGGALTAAARQELCACVTNAMDRALANDELAVNLERRKALTKFMNLQTRACQ